MSTNEAACKPLKPRKLFLQDQECISESTPLKCDSTLPRSLLHCNQQSGWPTIDDPNWQIGQHEFTEIFIGRSMFGLTILQRWNLRVIHVKGLKGFPRPGHNRPTSLKPHWFHKSSSDQPFPKLAVALSLGVVQPEPGCHQNVEIVEDHSTALKLG